MSEGEFWRGKRVLVTGHTGFKGCWLSVWLRALGADVVGYALAPKAQPSLFASLGMPNKIHSTIADVRDLNKLRALFGVHQPEIVFHLAAQSLVREGYKNPLSTYETNVMGTAHLLEVIRETMSVKAVVIVTSDKCYEPNNPPDGYVETDRLGGHDPYSSSKACQEWVAQTYRRCYFAKSEEAAIATVRAGNVIGGGDWASDRLVPDLVRAIQAHAPLQIRNPSHRRPWQHVLEPLSGYMRLAEYLFKHGHSYAQAWNFGPKADEQATVSEMVEMLLRLWGHPIQWVLDQEDHPSETATLSLNIDKAREMLGWQPRLTLSECCEWVVEWYQCYLNEPDKCAEISLKQIERFEAKGQRHHAMD